ncbi:MAG: pectinesterase family protein [Bacteroidales bacterium]|nr:pectinesterase family protein [Bacteroidales bacterium]
MKKNFTLLVLMLIAFSSVCHSNTIIVSINGGGQFEHIQNAIDNSKTGDTIKVWPGTYTEQININKNILLEGSGYENTIITSGENPSVIISMGTIKWFMISSYGGDGILMSGGEVKNCVINGCSGSGIYGGNSGGDGIVRNCVIANFGGTGIISNNGSGCYITITNCISITSGKTGYYGYCGYACIKLSVSYSDGSTQNVNGGQGCINSDPIFISSNDFHISQGSPCWDSGNPALQDPDGSLSDMGYFGGPDCPIYPVVYEIITTPNGDNINIEAKGRANY